MSDVIPAPAPAWLRIVAVLGLVWNLFGCYAYLQTVGIAPPDPSMPPEPMPAWVTGAFAIGVFGGALGSLGLVLLKSWSKLLLLLSFLSVIVTDVWTLAFRETQAGDDFTIWVIVNLMALLLVGLAYLADRRGWLS